jgi:hypothetical protein
MALTIEDAEVEALLTELEAATGKAAPQIMRHLLRRELAQHRKLKDRDQRRAAVAELTRRYRARLPERPPAPDDIIGYGDDGLPT